MGAVEQVGGLWVSVRSSCISVLLVRYLGICGVSLLACLLLQGVTASFSAPPFDCRMTG